MSKVANVLHAIADRFEKREVSVVPSTEWRKNFTQPVASGVAVNNDTALNFSAVFAAHKILGESVAMLPLHLYKRKGRSKEIADDKSLYTVLHDVANNDMDSYLARETMQAHLAGWGRAHAKLDYDANGQIIAMYPIHPRFVQVMRGKQGEIVHQVNFPDGTKKTYRADEMLYLRGISPDGITAYSPIQLARQGIGLALAAEQYGGTFFGNGAVPNGTLAHPGKMSQEAYDRLIESWSATHGGVSNANKTAILEEGMKYEKIGIPPDDAQFLQTRTFQVEEIARWYRIPAMMLAMSGANSTYASVEAFGLQFVIYTLYPWLVRWEKAIHMQMLLPNERKRYFAEHLMTAILRGDTQSRYAAYATGRQWGWLSANDIRDLENMNPIAGGDVYLTPANMMDANAPADDGNSAQRMFLPVMRDAIGRAIKREVNDLRGAVTKVLQKKGADAFGDWVSDFYQEHIDFIVRTLEPVSLSFSALIAEGRGLTVDDTQARVGESLRWFALRRAAQAQDQIKQALADDTPVVAVESLIAGWLNEQDIERLSKMQLSKQTAVLLLPKE